MKLNKTTMKQNKTIFLVFKTCFFASKDIGAMLRNFLVI